MNIKQILYSLPIMLFLGACQSDSTPSPTPRDTTKAPELKFEELAPEQSGVTFTNKLDLNILKHPYQYVNVYNGGGVALGDINNDGLTDLYFTGNLVENKLYLNKGNFQFEDITQKAGVACAGRWSTGATFADVNQDGFLDLYVCHAYLDEPAARANELFINNGDGTFTEKAAEMGVNDTGYSIQAAFFDYNRDGLPDLFVGNHPIERQRPLTYHHEFWKNPVPRFSDHLYKNNGDGTFTDVTAEAGILNYGWTLGIVTADLNQDNWPDIYVAVDHSEPDRYYLNNQDGTFREVSEQKMKHISLSSMGIDAADVNNDGLTDLTVMEMLSRSNFREKTKMASMNPKKFWTYVNVGYHYQYMRNMLHINTGEGTFSEIGQMANIQRTDWSWAALLADFDNDGWKDLYVANGYYREFLDKDHSNKYKKKLEAALKQGLPRENILREMALTASATRVENDFFRNNGDLTFSEIGAKVGVNHAGWSSGAAYADLDNDGDLDLVVSNIDDPASIYRNTLMEQGGRHFLNIRLKHPKNIIPTNTKITCETASGTQFQEMLYTRGYQSAVDGVIHFGLNEDDLVQKLTILWPDGKEQVLTDIPADQNLVVEYKNAKPVAPKDPKAGQVFEQVTAQIGVDFQHQDEYFDDYAKQVLLPHQMSQFGPGLAVGDVNGDGMEDFFVGGGNGQAGAIFIQNADGRFARSAHTAFESDKASDDLGAAFFDLEGDGDLDLYVVSGGNEFDLDSPYYRDRLYLNDGKGHFTKQNDRIPDIRTSGSCVKPFDFDGDGDLDLFVGGRHVPGKYPYPANSYLLENEGGKLKDVTRDKAPDLIEVGLVTDAVWSDFDGDQTPDLVLVGEWMPPTVLVQRDGKFEQKTAEFGLDGQVGWWFSIAKGDLDNDGDEDYILGNLGENYKYKARPEKPFHVYAKDFDQNGTYDIALGYFLESDVLYPVRGRQCSSEQLPEIAQKFPTYEDFGKASIFEVYGEDLNTALHYEATNFSSSVLINLGGGKYDLRPLPPYTQISPVNGIVIHDLDNDGNQDLLVAGNLFTSEVETGRADAGKGLFLRGDGKGGFTPVLPQKSGLRTESDAKHVALIRAGGKNLFLVANNNAPLEVWRWKDAPTQLIGLK
ncbi:MAG: hypothetical protein D6714_16465 [Bacteroidetes bacterium]|nr:MAG: hypothetical protein D6714_16465 [Bacteroidota bacterium]